VRFEDGFLPKDIQGTNIVKLTETGSEARMKKEMNEKWKGYYDFGG
jgi:hypothetical protein